MNAAVASWGRYPHANQRVLRINDRSAPLPGFEGHALPRGNGRSYGDVCLDDGGTLLDSHGLDRFIAFDARSGVLRCESGVLLGDILDLAVPRGWFLPVAPGTRYVSIGGAIANDVHGKNHHRVGSFGCHLRAFELLRSDGSRMHCTVDDNPDWFAATIGGLGLTGFVTWAELQLLPVPGAWFETETHCYSRLDDFFELSADSEPRWAYTVAWLDCTAKGRTLGRGVFSRGNHSPDTGDLRVPREGKLRIPVTPPFSLVNGLSLRVFNALYFARAPHQPRRSLQHYRPWLFPLDGVREWNRMYGPRGFLQYQCVLPPENARDGVAELLARIAASGAGSFLTVLKQFGAIASPGLLSFPRQGTTLAIDFALRGESTFTLLTELDDVVTAAGGAVYPAKDARMSAAMFRHSFPAWQAFEQYVDPRFSSGFRRRVME
ncbi:MAG TPA: FAD-binding oxidoreductase [Rhodanobacteraceae bacterium]|nr:FAD-binding oxidoreductase [Rhodanobacteraceae bacterium]